MDSLQNNRSSVVTSEGQDKPSGMTEWNHHSNSEGVFLSSTRCDKAEDQYRELSDTFWPNGTITGGAGRPRPYSVSNILPVINQVLLLGFAINRNLERHLFITFVISLLVSLPFGLSLFRRRHSESLFSILPYFRYLLVWHQLSACPPSLHP